MSIPLGALATIAQHLLFGVTGLSALADVAVADPVIGAVLAVLFGGITTLIAAVLVYAACAVVLDRIDEGEQPDALDGLRGIARSLLPLGWATIRMTIVTGLLIVTVIGIPIAVVYLIRKSVTTQSIVIEDRGGTSGLKRSGELVRRHELRVLADRRTRQRHRGSPRTDHRGRDDVHHLRFAGRHQPRLRPRLRVRAAGRRDHDRSAVLRPAHREGAGDYDSAGGLSPSPCATVGGMGLDSPITDVARSDAEQHILDHALGEADRIARLSRVREFVLGAQDGLLVPLGVVTGMAAANPGRTLLVVAGLAEAIAGAVAMGSGSYLASQAEEHLYAAEIRDEGQEVLDHPEREAAELALVLEHEGLPREQAEQVALGLAANPNVFLRTKVQKELGLSPDQGGAALGDALVVGGTYLGAALIPLWPYLVFDLDTALIVSLVCTLAALFALGLAKGRVARMSAVKSGLQVAAIGSISAALGFLIGRVVSNIAGGG